MKTGDIITADVFDLPFFIKHRAIIIKEDDNIYFCHNTPSKKNKFGGNVVCENYADFLKSRKIIKIKNTNITKLEIKKYALECKNKKFNLITFNCVDFVNYIEKKINQKK